MEELGALDSGLSVGPRFNDEPPFFSFSALLTGNSPDWCGATGTDEDSTRLRALGESLERYCIANHSRNGTIKGSEVDLEEVCLAIKNFSVQMVLGEHFHRTLCTAEDIIEWFPASDRKGRRLLVPSQAAIYVYEDEPFVTDSNTNGLACHRTAEQAKFSGLCELIERDAFLIRYLASNPAPRLSVPDDEKLLTAIDLLERYRLNVEFYDLDLGYGIPVAMAVLLDDSGQTPMLSLGFGCCGDGVSAMVKSLCEAVQIRCFSRMHKEDPDQSQGLDQIAARAVLWTSATKKSILHMIDENTIVEPRNIEFEPTEFIHSFPHELYFADLSLDGMAGFKVIKVICPDLVQLYFNDFAAPLRNSRLLQSLDGREPHKVSHPFA